MSDEKPKPRSFHDYSHEVNLARSPILRFLYLSLSGIFVILATIGAFLPLLPTTPFVLLAAFFYAKSSTRFYNWLMNHKIFGSGLREWKEFGSISLKAKVMSLSLLWPSLGFSIIWVASSIWLKLTLSLIGCGVTIFIISRPQRPTNGKNF